MSNWEGGGNGEVDEGSKVHGPRPSVDARASGRAVGGTEYLDLTYSGLSGLSGTQASRAVKRGTAVPLCRCAAMM